MSTPYKILVVEDEPDLAQTVCYTFQQEGYETLSKGTGTEGLEQARLFKPDLIILDLMLPDRSGFDVCKHLKNDPLTQEIPVLILSARGEEFDRILGFEVGADDYVLKPFSVRELILRVQAILKRSQTIEVNPNLLEFGSLKIQKESHQVWVNQEEVSITLLEFNLLCTLLERKGRTQSRSLLLTDVWGYKTAEITTRTVDTHIKRLREKIGPAGEYIQTIRGVGYRFKHTP